jgi:hypothetical protein
MAARRSGPVTQVECLRRPHATGVAPAVGRHRLAAGQPAYPEPPQLTKARPRRRPPRCATCCACTARQVTWPGATRWKASVACRSGPPCAGCRSAAPELRQRCRAHARGQRAGVPGRQRLPAGQRARALLRPACRDQQLHPIDTAQPAARPDQTWPARIRTKAHSVTELARDAAKTELQALLDAVEREPWAYDFYALLRRIDAMSPAAPAHRLRHAGPRRKRCAWRQVPSWTSRRRHWPELNRRDTRVTRHRCPTWACAFFGLLGPHGPLPLHLTEYRARAAASAWRPHRCALSRHLPPPAAEPVLPRLGAGPAHRAARPPGRRPLRRHGWAP